MERLAPCVCLVLLWGCRLAPAAAAQGKEGECERADPTRRLDPRTPAPPGARCSWTRATLETVVAPRSPGGLGLGERAGCHQGQSGTPSPGF